MKERSRQAVRGALVNYRIKKGTDTGQTDITDMIADLLLYAGEKGLGAEAILRMATTHYKEEKDRD